MNAVLLYPLILAAGALQAWGPPMNGALRNALLNPWLASLVSFLPIVVFLAPGRSPGSPLPRIS
jgi:transporter family-2 protein